MTFLITYIKSAVIAAVMNFAGGCADTENAINFLSLDMHQQQVIEVLGNTDIARITDVAS